MTSSIRSTLLTPLAFVLLAFLFTACSRPSRVGIYHTVGSEDKFRMTLEVREGGKAVFSTRSNLGSAEMDKTVNATMAIADGRWTEDKGALVVTGKLGAGKEVVYRFLVAPTGELFWETNGARFVRAK